MSGLIAFIKTRETMIVGQVTRADGSSSEPVVMSYRHRNPLRTLRYHLRRKIGRPARPVQGADGIYRLEWAPARTITPAQLRAARR